MLCLVLGVLCLISMMKRPNGLCSLSLATRLTKSLRLGLAWRLVELWSSVKVSFEVLALGSYMLQGAIL